MVVVDCQLKEKRGGVVTLRCHDICLSLYWILMISISVWDKSPGEGNQFSNHTFYVIILGSQILINLPQFTTNLPKSPLSKQLQITTRSLWLEKVLKLCVEMDSRDTIMTHLSLMPQ